MMSLRTNPSPLRILSLAQVVPGTPDAVHDGRSVAIQKEVPAVRQYTGTKFSNCLLPPSQQISGRHRGIAGRTNGKNRCCQSWRPHVTISVGDCKIGPQLWQDSADKCRIGRRAEAARVQSNDRRHKIVSGQGVEVAHLEWRLRRHTRRNTQQVWQGQSRRPEAAAQFKGDQRTDAVTQKSERTVKQRHDFRQKRCHQLMNRRKAGLTETTFATRSHHRRKHPFIRQLSDEPAKCSRTRPTIGKTEQASVTPAFISKIRKPQRTRKGWLR